MELETKDELGVTLDRLAAAATLLEQAAERMAQREQDTEARIGRVVATVESRREAELEVELAAAEAKIAELQARAGVETAGRKTLPPSMTTLLAKQGVTLDSIEAGAIDAALASLSIEQRIAVKSQLLRAGLLG
jgi:hypothetical protein